MRDFKVGDKVIYNDACSPTLKLTRGRSYVVLSIFSDLVVVFNDEDEYTWVSSSRLKLAEESTPVTKFQVGDIVEYAGLRGKVTRTDNHPDYPVTVNLGDVNRMEFFTEDGRLNVWHEKPLLHLVRRPKKKEKRQVSLYTYYSPSLNLTFPVGSEKLPDDAQLVIVSGEIEVEV